MKTDLDTKKIYRVVMPELEWTTRFQRLVQKAKEHPELNYLQPLAKEFLAPHQTGYSYTDAVCAYVENSIPERVGLLEHIEVLSRMTTFEK